MNYYNGNALTISPWAATAATTNTIIYTGGLTPWQATPQTYAPLPQMVPVIPDTPEAWLRHRVKEICDLAVAA